MHLLVNTIKALWCARQVTAALFLDIEGAFPNAILAQLLHNLEKRRVPKRITNSVSKMLTNRVTMLKFNGYMSEPMVIDNSIGQGDLLSMGLYQDYNADLLDILRNKGELSLAYIDDASMMLQSTDQFFLFTLLWTTQYTARSTTSPAYKYSTRTCTSYPACPTCFQPIPYQLPPPV